MTLGQIFVMGIVLASVALARSMAQRRGRSVADWTIAATLVGPLAVLLLYLKAPLGRRRHSSSSV
jgi:hypothetical protein